MTDAARVFLPGLALLLPKCADRAPAPRSCKHNPTTQNSNRYIHHLHWYLRLHSGMGEMTIDLQPPAPYCLSQCK